MKDTFSNMHPFINFIFFAFTIGFTMFIMNPVCIAVSFLCSLATALYLNGKKAVRLSLVYVLPMILLIAVINPVFNHEGVTILTYFPWDNPLTLESILYGCAGAVMLASTVLWFSSFNTVITSDKVVFLFGRIMPSLSLVISMALRFVPRFSAQMKLVRSAQHTLGRDINEGTIFRRIRNAVKILSIMITWSLENAIETADSMKSRGHGLKGRTSYSLYKFDNRDIATLLAILTSGVALIVLMIFNVIKFRYYPSVKGELFTLQSVLFYILYTLLMLTPIIINTGEGIKWKHMQSKI